MGKYDIPEEVINLQDYIEKHPELALREVRRLLYLVLDSVGVPVRIKKDLLVNTPPMHLFMQEDIKTHELVFTVERIEPDKDY